MPAIMNAGDALLLSGKTAHGGGANETSDEYRRAAAFALNPGFPARRRTPSWSTWRSPGPSPRVQRMLGFRSQYPAGSPGLWQVDYADLGDRLAL
ncbi:phytanoyl-CoA dioxygenase family protein [Streptomyces sp. NPDC015414]|uniref:phytanoyl-CoA dioxygenase family protein n=1 Tax=Streptomyces sp. NPDC015414 TaxID=3364957 RepID=UPI00370196DA